MTPDAAPRPRTRAGIALLLAFSIAGLVSDQGTRSAETWTIGNGRIEAELRLSADGLVINRIVNPQTGSVLTAADAVDSSIAINGSTAPLGSSAAGWVLAGVERADSDTDTLMFTFRSTRASIVAERTYACYQGSPTIEVWTTFRSTGTSTVTVSGLSVWELTIPANVVHYEYGLRGDAAGGQVDDAFSLQTQVVEPDEPFTLTERNRSTESFLPMVAADVRADEFFGGLAWSGSWQIQATAAGEGRLRVTAGLPGVSIVVDGGHPLETPHGFFGFTPGDRHDVATALRGFVTQGIRGGRPFQPLVTSNTWFSYGTDVDEASMKDEIVNAAANGVELFVVDAGWYFGAGPHGDFHSGLGTWRADPARFPEGLRALSDYAHDLGLRFGVWVEPERVDQSTVGRPGLAQQAWLASANGSFGSSRTAQICLANPAARQWIFDRLVELIDQANLDYLKWDNNFWLNCNRSGHGHGTSDGNFAHVRGLYDVLGALRERYPDLLIENCSGGGNRVDFGLLRYTDTAWMDDRSAPAVHVRHNLEGLSTFFPPAYLLSFAISDGDEPLSSDAHDFSLYVRSRMAGILGMTYRASELTESDQSALAREIGFYKIVREVQRDASAILLTPQAAPDGGPPWDVVEELSTSTGTAVIFAFQQDGGTPAVAVQPRGLTPAAIYSVTTVDGEHLGSTRGETLMRDGLTIDESPQSAARVIVLRPDRPPVTPSLRSLQSINGAKRDEEDHEERP